jgi:hypothetical protein
MNETTISSADFHWCKTTVSCSKREDPKPGQTSTAYFIVSSGSARMQTYATTRELRAIAQMLTVQADLIDMSQVPQLQDEAA